MIQLEFELRKHKEMVTLPMDVDVDKKVHAKFGTAHDPSIQIGAFKTNKNK